MEFPFQLLLGWSGLEGTPTPGDDQDLNSFTAAFHVAHRPGSDIQFLEVVQRASPEVDALPDLLLLPMN